MNFKLISVLENGKDFSFVSKVAVQVGLNTIRKSLSCDKFAVQNCSILQATSPKWNNREVCYLGEQNRL